MDANPFKYTFDMMNRVLPADHKVLFAFEQILLTEFKLLLDESRLARHKLTFREAAALAKKVKLSSKVAVHCVSHFTEDLKKLLARANFEAASLRAAVRRFVQPLMNAPGAQPK